MENEDLFNFEAEDQPIEQSIEETPSAKETAYVEEDVTYENDDLTPEEKNGKSYIDMLLEAKGAIDRKIKIQDDNGELIDVNFDDLTDQEKFDFLNEVENPVLPEDSELETINYLRKNNMTLDEFAEWQKKLGVEEYLAGQTQQTDIDSLSDDEIIAYDFIQRFGEEMSDEEIDAEIDRLKNDEDAYKKRVNLLRTSYKNEEIAQAQLYEQEQQKKNEADKEQFIQSYSSALQGINSIQGIELDENDKNELYQFVLTKDPNNNTAFGKLLNDPEQVFKMAWFALHGEEAMNNVVDYFKKEITKREKGSNPRVINKQTRQGPKDAFQF